MNKKNKFSIMLVCLLALSLVFVGCYTGGGHGGSGNIESVELPDSIFNTKPASIPENYATTFVKNMGIAINIGNTLDAVCNLENPWWHADENGWGAPNITPDFIKALKAHGYTSIRLPVTWKTYMGGAPDYLLGECQWPIKYPGNICSNCPNRMDRVEQVVDWILGEGLYCILNVHHDGEWISTASKNQAGATDQYKKVWAQIAARFANKSEKLVFESMNEVGFDDLWNRYAGGTTGKQQAYSIFNSLNQAFVDTVRPISGNQNRFLLIAGYFTDIGETVDPLFVMPTDTASHRMSVSVHYYTPAPFCLVDDRNNSWGFSETWGTAAEYTELINNFKKLDTRFIQNGIPVIMGEYAVVIEEKKDDNGNVIDIIKDRDSRIKWMSAVTQLCINYGICPVLWDTPGHEIGRESPYAMRDTMKSVWLTIKK